MSYYQYLFMGYPMPQYPEYPGYQAPQNQFQEQSYIENILRMNRGKTCSVYMNFENSQWGSKIFKGTLEAAGKDHIILSNPTSNTRYILLSIYLNYITFDEEINYFYPYER